MSDTPFADCLREYLAEVNERIEKLERENAELRKIYPLLASAWFYGNWKAETPCEKEMEGVMRGAGWWPWASEAELIAAIDNFWRPWNAAMKEKP